MLSNSKGAIVEEAGSESRWVSYRDERRTIQPSVKVPKY